MTKGVGKIVSGAVAAALLVTGSAPALAAPPQGPSGWHQAGWDRAGWDQAGWDQGDRDYWGGGRDRYRHRRHHRGGGSDTGAVIAGVAVVGVLAAILSSASREKRDQQARDEASLPPRSADRDDPYYGDETDSADAARPEAGRDLADGSDGVISGEDSAVNACAVAAEREAARFGADPGVRGIDSVEGSGREWQIGGTVETRDGNRREPASHRFTCSVRYGQIERVDVEQDTLALR